MTSGRRVATVAAAAVLVAAAGCAMERGPQRVGSFVDDATITSRIRADIAADKNVDAVAIQVETIDGTVTLSGVARTQLEKTTAESIAMKANGAKQIRNEIAVRPDRRDG